MGEPVGPTVSEVLALTYRLRDQGDTDGLIRLLTDPDDCMR